MADASLVDYSITGAQAETQHEPLGDRWVYRHLLSNRTVLRFIYAPPLSKYDTFDPHDLPNPPYPGAKRREQSVYYYWWAFLREHAGYWACCERGGTGDYAALYADFGDLRGPDFVKWWRPTGKFLFCEPQDHGVVFHAQPPVTWDAAQQVLVTIPLSGDLDTIVSAITQQVKPLLSAYRKQHKSISRARYPVYTKPVLASLYQTLMIYRAHKQHPTAPLYDLPVLAGLRVLGQDKPQRTALASRCLAQADALIRNVALGKFPCLDADNDAVPRAQRTRGPRKRLGIVS